MRNGLIFAICLALVGCKDGGAKPNDTGAPSPSAFSIDGMPGARPHLVRDQEGHLVPTRARPQDNPADVPKAPSAAPTWDLDRADPAKDYVERYIRSTRRYGDATPCVTAKKTGTRDGKAVVEVRAKDKPPAACPPSATGSAPRDTFLVDVDGDRLELASKGGAPLGTWPDGTDPGGPAGPPVEADAVPAKTRAALLGAKLTPVRAQLYARGAYLVVTLAGWREPVTLNAPPESLSGFVDTMCAANDGLPFGLFAGIDRATLLRVRCGDGQGARWDRL